MDLIHADTDRVEVGYISDFIKLDAEISLDADIDRNSFVLTMGEEIWEMSKIKRGHFIYVPGTEWGGPVEHIKHSTKTGQISLTGPTWRGLLARKVIEPPTGQAYFVLTATEANAALQAVIADRFGDFFIISTTNTEKAISGSWRYTNLLDGLSSVLLDGGLNIACAYDNTLRKATIEAVPITDYTSKVDLSQDYGIYLTSQEGGIEAYNHVIALGRGELTEREVIHLYRHDNGTITTEPPASLGMNDLVITYDYSNAESTEELIKGAKKRLQEYAPAKSVEMDTSSTGLSLNLGDKVSARDRLTGLVTTATVNQKILSITAAEEKIETKVG